LSIVNERISGEIRETPPNGGLEVPFPIPHCASGERDEKIHELYL
jgi:hypothetical protein